MIAKTPKSPYYAVIFTSIRTDEDAQNYADMASLMAALAAEQPGYLGVEWARNEVGITVSYWESLEAIQHWKAQADHLIAQQMGREKWYSAYKTRVCKVERDYGFEQV